jgi:hypothetical protein
MDMMGMKREENEDGRHPFSEDPPTLPEME